MDIWNRFFSGKSAGWTAAFSGVLVIFTGALVVVTHRANENSVVTQRAYVNFNTIIPQTVKSDDGKTLKGINFFVSWTNSGTTPTKTASSQVYMRALRSELPKGFDLADLLPIKRNATVVGPKASVFEALRAPINDIRDVNEGKSHLYFWGWFAYRDIFPSTPQRLTEFCVELTNLKSTKPDITDLSTEFNFNLVPCGRHDCYDEDCADYKAHTN